MKDVYCSDTDFKAMVGHIRTVCPPPKGCRVEVRRVRQSEFGDSGGECEKDGRKFTIRIRFEQTRQETEEVLIHEWAHMMAWRPYHPLSGDHGPD